LVAKAHWLEVTLTVDGELAEAVSEVLSRFVSNGVVVERGVKYINDEDEGTPDDGPVKVYGYLPVDDALEENRQRLLEALWHLGQIQPLPEAAFKTIEDQDWMAAWKKHYHPIPIGQKLLVLPAWYENQDDTRLAVRIDPSMAFGTGTHPTTRLCLEMVEMYVQPGRPVIDVGCGSGILSVAALRLGANHALGVDIDAGSVMATRENAQLNGVEQALETGLGSVDAVLAGQFSLKKAPLVLANILAPVIIRLFDDGLADLMEPGGVLVLSGILDTQADGVLEAAARRGLLLKQRMQITDWVSLALVHR
jgi:ribosomal protein L11 methyltransferase